MRPEGGTIGSAHANGGLLPLGELARHVRRLCALDRESATAGEAEAAELIAAELRSMGAEVAVERERAHGGYWWPVGLPAAAATLAGASRSRPLAACVGALAAAVVADDLRVGRRWFRRRVLACRETSNVVAQMGDLQADRTVVVVAHHDAAHAGMVFHPGLARSLFKRFPGLLERVNTTPPTLWGAVAGPALVALGGASGKRVARLAGAVVSLGHVVAMLDIGLRGAVAGANDNASAVAVLLSLGHWLSGERLEGVRIVLLSTGSEESLMEGMDAFGRRHFPRLGSDTRFVVLDTLGSPDLVLLEGEGYLGVRDYPRPLLAEIQACADELGVFLWRGLRFRNATDGFIALKAGFPAAMIGSVDRFKLPTNYHWHTDVPERVDFHTAADAARLVQALLRSLAAPRD
ncbi:MAG: M28 family metallopeptidase [Thermoleophilaceae bacterium]